MLSTKQRRSRARRRAARKVIAHELASEAFDPGAETDVITLLESSLAVVLEVRSPDGVSLYFGGVGTPWRRRKLNEARA